jgi:hypothetical protein
MATPQRPLPDAAKESVQNARDLLLTSRATGREALRAVRVVLEGKNPQPWQANQILLAAIATMLDKEATATRELERIAGMDVPPDPDSLRGI